LRPEYGKDRPTTAEVVSMFPVARLVLEDTPASVSLRRIALKIETLVKGELRTGMENSG